jgi:hypothetical protein
VPDDADAFLLAHHDATVNGATSAEPDSRHEAPGGGAQFEGASASAVASRNET